MFSSLILYQDLRSMNDSNRLHDAIRRGLAAGGNLRQELDSLGEFQVESIADAQSVVDGLNQLLELPVTTSDEDGAFRGLAELLGSVSTKQSFEFLARRGIPLLIEAYDARLHKAVDYEGDLLYALKMFSRYGTEPALDRVVAAANNPDLCDGYLWAVIFEQLGDDDPILPKLVRRLSNPLPLGFACVAFLDWINRLVREDTLAAHPFDSPAGNERLQTWLASSDEGDFSFAHSAAAAIPFLSDPARTQLLALAMDHPHVEVQMEAAWASTRLGSEGGRKFLERQCLNRNHSTTARAYLEELGLHKSIPEEADDPDFRAMAETCSWLAHPQEFGRPPDEIELFDTRELYWPPTNDWRPVWLFRYRYQAEGPDEADDVGIAMTGSITFALFDETNDVMTPEDIYALHCCWELEANDDPRAPAERTIEAGRALLEASPQEPPDPFEDF